MRGSGLEKWEVTFGTAAASGRKGSGILKSFRVLSGVREIFPIPLFSKFGVVGFQSRLQASGAVGSSASCDISVCKHQRSSKPDSESRSGSQEAKNSESISYLYAQTTPGPTVDSGGGVVESVTVWRSLLVVSDARREVQSLCC
jgi:hypothetical protein